MIWFHKFQMMCEIRFWEDELDWAEEIVFKKEERLPELPEDIAICLLRKNPELEKLIQRFNLQIEY